MKILITGTGGFIGSNLSQSFKSEGLHEVIDVNRETETSVYESAIVRSDLILHFAGVNRECAENYEYSNNIDLAKKMVSTLKNNNLSRTIYFASTTQVKFNTPYGNSKLEAEKIFKEYARERNTKLVIMRLPGIFGKNSKPKYNSVVATFCDALLNNMNVQINKQSNPMPLIYIDDLISSIKESVNDGSFKDPLDKIKIFTITPDELHKRLINIQKYSKALNFGILKDELDKRLYSTYISFMRERDVFQMLNPHQDVRGEFLELFKFGECGQISFISINPLQSRGGHYHDSKVEKFFVCSGVVKFKFRNIYNNDSYEITASQSNRGFINTVPGWEHTIINESNETTVNLIVWASEVYDSNKPDTYLVVKNE